MLLVSFLGMIGLGTIGMQSIPGLFTTEPLSFLDSLFTVTSAVCITGLVVADTGAVFTFWGELYLLLLIQLGGLGILTLASAILSAMGLRPSIKAEMAMLPNDSVFTLIPTRRLIADVLKFTLLFETLGAIALYLIWAPQQGWQAAIWPAIFHSVSAFCNAGFSLHSNSLIDYRNSPVTLLVITGLVVAGGIGFITLEEFFKWIRTVRGRSRYRISLHSQVVLWGTLLLLIVPPFIFGYFEWNRSLSELRVTDKVVNSLFLSVTPRTAGFNTIDYGSASESTILLTMILMMIGGAPASLAGGMKITTFMLLGLLAWSRIRRQHVVNCRNRTIPDNTVYRAVGVFVIMTTLMIIGLFILQVVDEPAGADRLLIARVFEVVSAMNTVGLSMGLSDDLSAGGKIVVVAMTFIGRIGPLTLLTAFDESSGPSRDAFRYAAEDVLVG